MKAYKETDPQLAQRKNEIHLKIVNSQYCTQLKDLINKKERIELHSFFAFRTTYLKGNNT